jgi:hypothetical protein
LVSLYFVYCSDTFNEKRNVKYADPRSRFNRQRAKRCEGVSFVVVGGKKRVSRHRRHWNSSVTKYVRGITSNKQERMYIFFGRMVWATELEFQSMKSHFLRAVAFGLCFSSIEQCFSNCSLKEMKARLKNYMAALKDNRCLELFKVLLCCSAMGCGDKSNTIFDKTCEEEQMGSQVHKASSCFSVTFVVVVW